MKEYFIKKRNYTPDVWNEIEPAKIDSNKWLPAGPPAEAKVFYDGENLYIRYEVKENSVTIRAKKMHDPVYQDSCAEFFMRPAKDKRYLNFETNAVGTMLLGLGETGEGRERVEQDPSIFEMKPSIKNPDEFKGDKWTLEYKIPFSFLRKITEILMFPTDFTVISSNAETKRLRNTMLRGMKSKAAKSIFTGLNFSESWYLKYNERQFY